jgi:hypothetical protein
MITAKKLTGLALATAAAGLFVTAAIPAASAAEEAKVHCDGVNACKGESACQSAHNSCKGMNSCKGKGWLYLSKADCEAAKAKLKKEEMKK